MKNFAQAPQAVFMVRPACFGFNPETASSNAFQKVPAVNPEQIARQARTEFDAVVRSLTQKNIPVVVLEDSSEIIRPDAVFPNNWLSLHEDGKAILYPMLSEARRMERRTEFIEQLKQQFVISEIIDFTPSEEEGKIVEGTGSLVFDHPNRLVYASLSDRTDETLTKIIAKRLQYQPVIFHAIDEAGRPVYHTNVLLCVGTGFAVICLDAIPDPDQEILLGLFETTNKKVIAISYEQMRAFAGNMLEVQNSQGEPFIILSQAALDVLLPGQVRALAAFGELLPVNIPTIEAVGGGSIRCMLGGIHAPRL
jgi:hypothetical protein